MIIHILEKSYLVLYTIEGKEGELNQHVCRDIEGKSEREYRAVKVPSGQVTGELVRFLMEQVHHESFHEFVNYVTDAEGLTAFLDCGLGVPLNRKLLMEKPSLSERLELSKKLLEHLVLSDFPPYFIDAAMDWERVKVTEAMDFGFDFSLSNLADFAKVDLQKAFLGISKVLSHVFEPELRRRAFPDMERFLYQLSHGEFGDLLSVYQKLLEICQAWTGKDENKLESKSFVFVLWEIIKKLGKGLRTLGKILVVLLAAAYLGYSIYLFVQPDPVGAGFEKIGELEIKKQTETEIGGDE